MSGVVAGRFQKLWDTVTGTGCLTEKERWFAAFDIAESLETSRHCLTFLVDLTLATQRAAPWSGKDVSFEDTVNDVFSKETQSMRVAAHILRDTRLFEVGGDARPGCLPNSRQEFPSNVGLVFAVLVGEPWLTGPPGGLGPDAGA